MSILHEHQPTFTTRHYEALAAVLKPIAERPRSTERTVYEVVTALDELFREDNPRFKSTFWWDAIYDMEGKLREVDSGDP